MHGFELWVDWWRFFDTRRLVDLQWVDGLVHIVCVTISMYIALVGVLLYVWPYAHFVLPYMRIIGDFGFKKLVRVSIS